MSLRPMSPIRRSRHYQTCVRLNLNVISKSFFTCLVNCNQSTKHPFTNYHDRLAERSHLFSTMDGGELTAPCSGRFYRRSLYICLDGAHSRSEHGGSEEKTPTPFQNINIWLQQGIGMISDAAAGPCPQNRKPMPGCFTIVHYRYVIHRDTS